MTMGDLIADDLKDPEGAERWWLRAVRSTANTRAMERLLERTTGRPRLRARTFVAAAAATLGDSRCAKFAAEAGAILAGLTSHPRLGIALYQRASAHAADPLPTHLALVELHRALGEHAEALEATESVLALASGVTAAGAFESRAEILTAVGDEGAAIAARRSALEIAPELTPTARALERALQTRGDHRAAIEVRRAHASAAEDEKHRAQTFAHLATRAEELDDGAPLAISLRTDALKFDASLSSVRLSLVDNFEQVGRFEDAAEALSLLVLDENLEFNDRAALARRQSQIERDQLAEPARARRTLREFLEVHPAHEALIRDLAVLEEELGEPSEAAARLEDALTRFEAGGDVLGGRREVLEWIARLREESGETALALDRLQEAATLGRLGQHAELSRARLAEQLGEEDVAIAALNILLDDARDPPLDAEDRVAFLGRLALACERAGHVTEALDAWRARGERLPNDLDALLAIERLGRDLDALDDAAAATTSLLRLEAGDERAQRARWVWLSDDARERADDPKTALGHLERARALGDDEQTRAALYRVAAQAADNARALEVLDEMHGAGDRIAPPTRLEWATLVLDELSETERALDIALHALDEDNDLNGAAFLARVDRGALIERFLRDDTPARDQLADAIGGPDGLSNEQVSALADAMPSNFMWTRAAAATASLEDASERLVAFAARTDDDEARADALSAAAQRLASDDAPLTQWLTHFNVLKDDFAATPSVARAALRGLRDGEAFEQVAELLELCIACEPDPDARRELRLELVAVCRTALDTPGSRRSAPRGRGCAATG